jgi:hypothetical protein
MASASQLEHGCISYIHFPERCANAPQDDAEREHAS